MPLILEDGTGVTNANSFASVDDLETYALLRGLTLPSTDAEKEVLLVQAGDFLNGLESRYKGSRVDAHQAMCWPRENVYLFDSDEAEEDDSIPDILLAAQCQLAYDAITHNLQATGTGREVIRQKVDVIETEYAPGTGQTVQAVFNKAMTMLEPLFESGGIGLSTLRV
jgi:hypothetical protein